MNTQLLRRPSWPRHSHPTDGLFVWTRVIEGIAAWKSESQLEGDVLLQVLSIAKHFKIPLEQVEEDFGPIITSWNNRFITKQSIRQQINNDSAPEPGRLVTGLRALGISIDLRYNRKETKAQ